MENLTEYVVRTPQEVMQFLAAGKKKLVFGETKMNRTSSRYLVSDIVLPIVF